MALDSLLRAKTIRCLIQSQGPLVLLLFLFLGSNYVLFHGSFCRHHSLPDPTQLNWTFEVVLLFSYQLAPCNRSQLLLLTCCSQKAFIYYHIFLCLWRTFFFLFNQDFKDERFFSFIWRLCSRKQLSYSITMLVLCQELFSIISIAYAKETIHRDSLYILPQGPACVKQKLEWNSILFSEAS